MTACHLSSVLAEAAVTSQYIHYAVEPRVASDCISVETTPQRAMAASQHLTASQHLAAHPAADPAVATPRMASARRQNPDSVA